MDGEFSIRFGNVLAPGRLRSICTAVYPCAEVDEIALKTIFVLIPCEAVDIGRRVPPGTRFPSSASGTCCPGPHCPWPLSFPPSSPQPRKRLCSTTLLVLWGSDFP